MWVESLFSFFLRVEHFILEREHKTVYFDSVVTFNAKRNENLRHDCVEVGRLQENVWQLGWVECVKDK